MTAANQGLINSINSLFDCDWETYYYDEQVRVVYGHLRELADRYFEIKNMTETPAELEREAFSMKVELLRLKKELLWSVEKAKEKEAQSNNKTSELQKMEAMMIFAKESNELARMARTETGHNHKRLDKALNWARLSVAASVMIALLSAVSQFYFHQQNNELVRAAINSKLDTTYRAELKEELRKEMEQTLNTNERSLLEVIQKENTQLKGKVTEMEQAFHEMKENQLREKEAFALKEAEVKRQAQLVREAKHIKAAVTKKVVKKAKTKITKIDRHPTATRKK